MSKQKSSNRHRAGSDSSGEFYITKRGIVKKPHAPLTSVPLDEDFDIQTQLGGTTVGPASVWADRVRASTARDPREFEYKLEETNETRNSWSDQREFEDDDRTARPLREYEDNRDEAWTVPVETDIMTTIPVETDAGTRYDGEWETITSQQGGASAPPPMLVQQRRSPIDPRDKILPPPPPRTKTPSIRSVRNSPRAMHSPASSFSQLKGLRQPVQPQQPIRTAISNTIQQQQKGLEYELMDNRVVENTPERTVTISSWREDVIRKSRPDIEMSVYYVSPDDYMDGEHEEDSGIGMVDLPKSTASKEPENVLLSNGSTPKKKERRTKSSASTKVEEPFRSSTPNRTNAPPFRATKSGGSTISTIPLAHSLSCDPILESSLSSCKPSLHHLSLPLSELGIRTVDHLQAISRMSTAGSGTAYQEVRKEAYRRGITVAEWAILMDKGRDGP